MEGGQKLPVWSWLPTKGVHAPDKETVFDIYEVRIHIQVCIHVTLTFVADLFVGL
ncbi:hypothetical protein DPMN_097143 [Dreissena polymorpha]|uniref:Uncharacterized protein n=1 Tax=Dreissena polymorpha TaxID=45954 RepID=A0A9D4LB70_DREPO|nr:hypothetical protein DPMN_097143 [Dreissena polymorpha]